MAHESSGLDPGCLGSVLVHRHWLQSAYCAPGVRNWAQRLLPLSLDTSPDLDHGTPADKPEQVFIRSLRDAAHHVCPGNETPLSSAA